MRRSKLKFFPESLGDDDGLGAASGVELFNEPDLLRLIPKRHLRILRIEHVKDIRHDCVHRHLFTYRFGNYLPERPKRHSRESIG